VPGPLEISVSQSTEALADLAASVVAVVAEVCAQFYKIGRSMIQTMNSNAGVDVLIKSQPTQ